MVQVGLLARSTFVLIVTGALGCNNDVRSIDVDTNPGAPASTTPYPTVIATAPALHGVQVDSPDGPVDVPCGTCHKAREADTTVRSTAELDEFHIGLNVAHGNLACVSCHEATDYDSLHLADGTRVPYSAPLPLCAQCHGPQYRDYQHGAHGGWNGHWDKSRGPRIRNQCTHCHDPHAPAYPHMQPTFKPVDRFLEPEHGHGYDGGKSDARGH